MKVNLNPLNLTEFYSPHFNKDNSLAELKIWKSELLENNEVIRTNIDVLRICSSSILKIKYYNMLYF